MSKNQLALVGILGGMGPLATADFYYKLVRSIKAEKDQDFNRIIIDSNSQIPDRIEAILHNGQSPEKALKESARQLVDLGAKIIAVPCHTVHPFIEKIKTDLSVPIWDMVSFMVFEIRRLKLKKIGILASAGLFRLNLYAKILREYGVETVELSEEMHNRLVEPVRQRVKKNLIDRETIELLQNAVTILRSEGAPVVALACSDLPIAWTHPQEDVWDCNFLFAGFMAREIEKLNQKSRR